MKLSLFIPTHYSSTVNYASIFNVIQLAENPNIEVIVSDNSENSNKFDILTRFASKNIKIVRGPFKFNHQFAFEQTCGDYVMCVGDDDTLLPTGLLQIIKNLEIFIDKTGAIGIYGRDMGNSYDFTTFSKLDAESLSTRLTGLTETIGIGNPLFHAVIRRDVMKKIYDFYTTIPNLQAYHDHIASLLMVGIGPIHLATQPYFIYNFKNWKTLGDRIDSELRYLNALNLPASLVLIHRLILATEGYFLIQSKWFHALDEIDRQHASFTWFQRWFELWQISLKDGYQNYGLVKNCKFFTKVNNIVKKYQFTSDFDTFEMLDEISKLYDLINSSGDQYKKFWLTIPISMNYGPDKSVGQA